MEEDRAKAVAEAKAEPNEQVKGRPNEQVKAESKNKAGAVSGKRSTKSVITELVIYVLLAFVAIYIIPKFVIGRVSVDGPSMEATLNNGDQLLGEHITAYTGNYDRFDVIFFHPKGKEVDSVFIKRIIGMPGERVRIDAEGTIFVNGVPLEEHFGKEKIQNPGRAVEEIWLAEDEYFVLGDNRNNSTDSRSNMVGNVKAENIDGVAIFRIWPLDKFGTID